MIPSLPSFRRALAVLVSAFLLSSSLLAQAPPRAEEPSRAERLRELSLRWQAKPEEERELLRERFHRLQELPEDERELFVERGRRLADLRRELGLERGQAFERALRRRAQEGREALRARLPRPLLEELEGADSERRPVLLERTLRRLRRERTRHFLERLGRELELDERELGELDRLPEGERPRRLLELRRRLFEGRREHGHRPWRERWERAREAAPGAARDEARERRSHDRPHDV